MNVYLKFNANPVIFELFHGDGVTRNLILLPCWLLEIRRPRMYKHNRRDNRVQQRPLRVSVLLQTSDLFVFGEVEGEENPEKISDKSVYSSLCVCSQILPQTFIGPLVPPRITSGISDNYAKNGEPRKREQRHKHTRFLVTKTTRAKTWRGLSACLHKCLPDWWEENTHRCKMQPSPTNTTTTHTHTTL